MNDIDVDGSHVPILGLGTWRLSGDACRQVVADGLAMGYRHLDTAQAYDNEVDVGRGLATSQVAREDVWLTTKLKIGNASRSRVGPSVEESLKRLGTDHVDLLLIHWPEPNLPCEESLEAMVEVRERGLARHLGVSNFPPSLLARARAVAPVVTDQVEYHPLLSQKALLRQCRASGMFLTAYAPLARGLVTQEPCLLDIGRELGRTAAQVALRWLIQQPGVAAIPKASSSQRLRENLGVFDFEMTEEHMDAISELDRGVRLVDSAKAPGWERT